MDRNRISFASLVSLGLVAAATLSFGAFTAFSALTSVGCNSAEVSVPPPIDAGPPCSTLPTQYKGCDAGPQAAVAMCVADTTSSDPTVARIPAGQYPVGCQVQFYFTDLAAGGSCGPAPNPCICLPNDAGASEDGGPLPGQWSNCADAGFASIQ